jgi:hypothetical protein
MARRTVSGFGWSYLISGGVALNYLNGTPGNSPGLSQNCAVALAFTNVPAPISGVNFYLTYDIYKTSSGDHYFAGAMDLSLANALMFNWVSGIQGTLVLSYAYEYWDFTGAYKTGLSPTYSGTFTPSTVPPAPLLPSTPVFTLPTPSLLPTYDIIGANSGSQGGSGHLPNN